MRVPPSPVTQLAAHLDFSDPVLDEVETIFFERAPDELARNATVSEASAARYLGVAPGYEFHAARVIHLLYARRLTPSERRTLLSCRRTDAVVAAFLRNQCPSAKDVTRLLDLGIGAESADYLLEHAIRLLHHLPDLADVIDHATPLTRLIWLSLSSVGDYPEHAPRWVASAPSQLSPWVPRLAALRRPDLLAAFVAAPHRKVREAAARSGNATDAEDQATLLALPPRSVSDPAALLAWLAHYGPCALALALSTRIAPALLDELAAVCDRVSHAAVQLDAQHRAAATLTRAVRAARLPDASQTRDAFWAGEFALEDRRLDYAYRAATRQGVRPAPQCDRTTPPVCSASELLCVAAMSATQFLKELTDYRGRSAQVLTWWLVDAIGTDRLVWGTMLGLLPEWSLTMRELAETVTALAARGS